MARLKEYYEIYIDNEYYKTVYDTQDIIRENCDLVNGYNINPDNITVKTITNKDIL